MNRTDKMDIMRTSDEVYEKYFGLGLSQDPVKAAVVRVFCSVLRGDDYCSVWFRTMSDETVARVLDRDDYEIWLEAKRDYQQQSLNSAVVD